MVFFLLAAFVSYMIVEVLAQPLHQIPAQILSIIAGFIAILLLLGFPGAVEPETTQAALGVLAAVLVRLFPAWHEVRDLGGKAGVRTWWLLSLSVGLFLIALTALLAPYGPSLFSRMNKFAVGAADVEFAQTGAEKQLLLAGDRDLSDVNNLRGAIEVPFIQYECGLAALKSGGLDNFKNAAAGVYSPSYQDFQHAIWFRTKSPLALLIDAVIYARQKGYGTDELQTRMRPIAEQFGLVVSLASNLSPPDGKKISVPYTKLTKQIADTLSLFGEEGIKTADDPGTSKPDKPWCEPSVDNSPGGLIGLVNKMRYAQDLAAAVLGFTGNSEQAIHMARLGSDNITESSTNQQKAMEMNARGALAQELYFGGHDGTEIFPLYRAAMNVEEAEEKYVRDCDPQKRTDIKSEKDREICTTLQLRYGRARADIEKDFAYVLAQEDTGLGEAQTYAKDALAAFDAGKFYLTDAADFDTEFAVKDVYAYVQLVQQRHVFQRYGVAWNVGRLHEIIDELETLKEMVRTSVPKHVYFTEYDRQLWKRRISSHLNLARSMLQ